MLTCKQCFALFPRSGGRGRPSAFCGDRCRNRYYYERRTFLGLLTCADCGKPMQLATTSAPQGSARHLSCRRRAHGLDPSESVNAAKASGRLSTAKRRGDCRRCGATVPAGTRRWKYCSVECFRKVRNSRGSGRPSASARGYGMAHQRLRLELLPLAYGRNCHLCGEVMSEGDDLHLDHTEDRTGYRGMVHSSCNILDGARRGGHAARMSRVREGWRPGQDPSTRRRYQTAARSG